MKILLSLFPLGVPRQQYRGKEEVVWTLRHKATCKCPDAINDVSSSVCTEEGLRTWNLNSRLENPGYSSSRVANDSRCRISPSISMVPDNNEKKRDEDHDGGEEHAGPTAEDPDTLQELTNRLTCLQSMIHQQRKEMLCKDRQIKVLEDKLRIFIISRGDNIDQPGQEREGSGIAFASRGDNTTPLDQSDEGSCIPVTTKGDRTVHVDQGREGVFVPGISRGDNATHSTGQRREGSGVLSRSKGDSAAATDQGREDCCTLGISKGGDTTQTDKGRDGSCHLRTSQTYNAADVSQGKTGGCSSRHVREMERRCLLLLRQIHQMEDFLADYGMLWVGEVSEEGSVILDDFSSLRSDLSGDLMPGEDEEEEDGYESGFPFKIDFDLLMENIQDLSKTVLEEQVSLQRTLRGTGLKKPAPMQVTLYSNGLVMGNAAFRPYSNRSAQQCVLDFMDGYFPSELQSRYPEGVPFSVTDKRDTMYRSDRAGKVLDEALAQLWFCPKDVNADPQPASAVVHQACRPSSSTQADISSDTSAMSAVRDHDELTKAGVTVVEPLTGERHAENVRMLEGNTDVKEASLPKAESGETTEPTPNSCTLKIRSETGDHTYLLHMHRRDTVSHLRQVLNGHRMRQNRSKDYIIRSAYPPKVYPDDRASLESCGLFPNGVLYLQSAASIQTDGQCLTTTWSQAAGS